MEINITSTEKNYNFKPESTVKEISQNLENIISRVKGNIPLAREKGIIITNLDLPQTIIQAQLISAVDKKKKKEEKRFNLLEAQLNFEKSSTGVIVGSLKGEINEW